MAHKYINTEGGYLGLHYFANECEQALYRILLMNVNSLYKYINTEGKHFCLQDFANECKQAL